MKDVALFKAQHHKAVEDLAREKVVLINVQKSIAKTELAPLSAIDFFKAQIAVAKAIQYRYRADYLSQPIYETPKNLHKVVRPALITLGNRIIKALNYVVVHTSGLKASDFKTFNQMITVKNVSFADKELLFKALLKIYPKLSLQKENIPSDDYYYFY